MATVMRAVLRFSGRGNINAPKSLTFEAVNLPFFIARRYLVKQKGTFSSFIIRLAIVATALSVAVMILSLAVVTGFEHAIKGKLYSFMGHVHVSTFDPTKSNKMPPPVALDARLMAEMKRIPHVVQVTPFTERLVILQAHGTIEGLGLKGVDEHYKLNKSLTLTGKPIDYSDSFYSRQVILSESTAGKLNVGPGDTVLVEFLEANGMPRFRRVIVSGLYHSGLDEVDKNFALCDTRLLQHMNKWTADSINAYQLDLDNAAFADTVSDYIHFNLINAPLESYTMRDIYPYIQVWLDMVRTNSVIILAIMAIVSIINMGAVILILMVDRAAMVGLLKALGMQFSNIVAIFLYISGLIGLVGVFAGNILGLGLVELQLKFGIVKLQEETYYMKFAPVEIVWRDVLITDAATVALCVFCMWLPALYIRTIQPARVLQFK